MLSFVNYVHKVHLRRNGNNSLKKQLLKSITNSEMKTGKIGVSSYLHMSYRKLLNTLEYLINERV